MILTKLTLSGQGKKDAILTFQEGLNVISGDSDTGKTYAFQCINYMLGKENPPKEIQEAAGYTELTLEFTVEGKSYKLCRTIGSNYLTAYYDNIVQKLSYKHDPTSSDNLSRFLLQILSEQPDNIYVYAGGKKKTRTLSFRDVVHLCTIAETDIIAESSAFQSIQYTEKTVRSSVLKFIITNQDDSQDKQSFNTEEEKIRRAGVVQFLEKKRKELIENIAKIENDDAFKLYVNDPALKKSIEKIQSLRKEIYELNNNISKNAVLIGDLNKRCFADETKISEFKKLEIHYTEELKKIDMLSSYEDFVSQLPQVACPFCNQQINPEALTEENQEELFNYWLSVQQELKDKKSELLLSIEDIEERLNFSHIELQKLQTHNDNLSLEVAKKRTELDYLGANIAKMRELDEMQNALKMLHKELLSVIASIEEYSKKVIREKEKIALVDNSQYNNYCNIIVEILKSWGFGDDTKATFNANNLDLILNGKQRITWGKGYRAFIMSAMVIGLMRYCIKYNRLHPGFVIIDSPLVSLKERKKDSSEKWIDSYMEQKMVEDILRQDSKSQVIIFENKDIKFNYDYNYVEYNHEGEEPNGFIPKP